MNKKMVMIFHKRGFIEIGCTWGQRGRKREKNEKGVFSIMCHLSV